MYTYIYQVSGPAAGPTCPYKIYLCGGQKKSGTHTSSGAGGFASGDVPCIAGHCADVALVAGGAALDCVGDVVNTAAVVTHREASWQRVPCAPYTQGQDQIGK